MAGARRSGAFCAARGREGRIASRHESRLRARTTLRPATPRYAPQAMRQCVSAPCTKAPAPSFATKYKTVPSAPCTTL